jgi:hypothetical protein
MFIYLSISHLVLCKIVSAVCGADWIPLPLRHVFIPGRLKYKRTISVTRTEIQEDNFGHKD